MSKTFKESVEIGDLVVFVNQWETKTYLILSKNHNLKIENIFHCLELPLNTSIIYHISLREPIKNLYGWFTFYDYHNILKPSIKQEIKTIL